MDSIYIDEYKDAKNQKPNRLYEYTLEYQNRSGEWIEISSGSVYDTDARVVAASETSHSYVAIGFEPVEATALRLTGPANISFYEFEAYGSLQDNSRTLLEQALQDAGAIDRGTYSEDSLKHLDDAVALGGQALQNGDSADMKAAADAIYTAVASLKTAKAVITGQPKQSDVAAGDPAAFTVTAEGIELAYQWQEYCDGLWVSIPDAVQDTLIIPAVAAEDDGRMFRCVVTDLGGSVLSEQAGLHVISTPVTPVDKQILNTVLAYAEQQFASPEFQNVIETVRVSYTAALEQARSVSQSSTATQEQVDAAWKTLMTEIHKLGFVQGDKTLLKQLIQVAEGYVSQSGLYTPSTLNKLLTELDAAKAVDEDRDALEQDVVTARDNLLQAMLNLRLKADKSVLEAVLNQAGKIEIDRFTPETVSMFHAACQRAGYVRNDPEATQDEVNEAVSQLYAAMNALKTEPVAGDASQTAQAGNAKTGEAAPLAAAATLLVLAGVAFLFKKKK